MPDETRDNLTKSKRLIWLVIILILLLLIIALLYWFLGLKQPQEQVVNINVNLNQAPVSEQGQPAGFNNADQNVVAEVQGLNGGAEEAEEDEQADILFIATAFAERFGSYSNQGEYRNFDELAIFMTKSMSDWVATYKEDLKTKNPIFNTYYAIETKAISSKIEQFDEDAGNGEIIVKTQRQEFENDISNPEVFYQDIILQITKINNEWKVNAAYWQ